MSVFGIAIRVIGLESVLPVHAGAGHAERAKDPLAHQIFHRPPCHGLHHQLQQLQALTGLGVTCARFEMNLCFPTGF